MRVKDFFRLFLDAFTQWNEDRGSRLGAAVAYFTIFSLAPLLVVVIAVAGLGVRREGSPWRCRQADRGYGWSEYRRADSNHDRRGE